MNVPVIRLAMALFLCVGVVMHAAEGKRGREKNGSQKPTQASNCNDVRAHPIDLVLGRPTRDSVTLSVLTYRDTEAEIAYGTQRGQLTRKTSPRHFAQGEAAEVVIGSLKPDTRYFYQFRAAGLDSAEGTFHTQRLHGKSFTFAITADSHLDDRTSAKLYQRTLANALADAPDFHMDLGDTFMTEKHESREEAARQYLAQRFYFGQLCRSAPLSRTSVLGGWQQFLAPLLACRIDGVCVRTATTVESEPLKGIYLKEGRMSLDSEITIVSGVPRSGTFDDADARLRRDGGGDGWSP